MPNLFCTFLPFLLPPLNPLYILCILVFIVSACRLLYSLLSSVLSSPPTSPHPARGTTTHVQLSEAPKSSAKWTIVLAAREGSRERRARSMISWSEMREVIPSVARIMYAWASPSTTLVSTCGSTVTPDGFHLPSPNPLVFSTAPIHLDSPYESETNRPAPIRRRREASIRDSA